MRCRARGRAQYRRVWAALVDAGPRLHFRSTTCPVSDPPPRASPARAPMGRTGRRRRKRGEDGRIGQEQVESLHAVALVGSQAFLDHPGSP